MRFFLAVSLILVPGIATSTFGQTGQAPKAPAATTPATNTSSGPQIGAESNKPVPAPVVLPFTTQVKKSVVFIQTDCLHVPTPEELSKMTPTDQASWSEENLAQWTPQKLSQLRPEELAKWKRDSHSGTGFVVFFPDERFGKDKGFLYLITNRHVVQPGVENGRPCKPLNYSVALNHKGNSSEAPPYVVVNPLGPLVNFVFPKDSAVDLAALPLSLVETDWDFQSVSLEMFATSEMIAQHQVVEGDPVLFSGLFVQYSGGTKLEPVVRTGTLAMLPNDLLNTTLGKPGHIYLAEAHSFGGNSGSPMFVDTAKFRNPIGFDYKLLGVVCGEVLETSDLTLQVTTSYKASVTANSNISMIVPADEVRTLLQSPELLKLRDAVAAANPVLSK